jgi:hypothetical protein
LKGAEGVGARNVDGEKGVWNEAVGSEGWDVNEEVVWERNARASSVLAGCEAVAPPDTETGTAPTRCSAAPVLVA